MIAWYSAVFCSAAMVTKSREERRGRVGAPPPAYRAFLLFFAIILTVLSYHLLAWPHHPARHHHSSSAAAQGQQPAQGQPVTLQQNLETDPPGGFVIGMTSVHRPGNVDYLSKSVLSLYCALNTSEGTSSTVPRVLVLNGNVPAAVHTSFMALYNDTRLEGPLQKGLTLVTLDQMHSELHTPLYVNDIIGHAVRAATADPMLEIAANDPPTRFFWRSKEVLDTAYIMDAALKAAPHAKAYVHLQDDIRVAPGFLGQIEKFLDGKAQSNETVDVITLFTDMHGVHPAPVPDPYKMHFGLVGLVFRMPVLRGLVPYLRSRFSEEPVDWLINRYIKDNKLSFWVYHPNLVQHIGVQSSLENKTQTIQSRSFRADGPC